ncbi:RloB family protein [Mycobacteroides abscessus]|uniref:RloB family protein n=1 Tax=Mycobacteroides abscessus TaxID=36809 RepID=UPI0009A59608|nr:RloB family protein [Mycobacteroides abscessus]SLF85438.1 Uncharacterised protein [Mycobacteroides abscessus subsp. abscessus]
MTSNSRGSRARHQRRRPSTQAQRFQIRIFAEGKETEVGYINHYFRRHRDQVLVSVAEHQGSAPLTVVEAAVAERKYDLREEKRRRGSAYDEYWCMVDVDEHYGLDDALQLAAANGVKVALSSPCLEVWFLLHDRLQAAFLDGHAAQHESKKLLGCDKTLSDTALALLEEQYETALANAKQLDAKHRGDGTQKPWNPGSNVWELIETIRSAASLPGSGVPFSAWHL